jgi:hypothetical protein
MMKYRYTAELVAARHQSTEFENKPNSYRGKIRCKTCGADGYPGGSWMDKHMEPHVPCEHGCPKSFTRGQGLAAHYRKVHPR